MRLAALSLIGSLALAGMTASAIATPGAPANLSTEVAASLVPVSGGCGLAFHRNPWGYCVPNRYAYGYYPYYGPYYGPYYHHHWHHWY